MSATGTDVPQRGLWGRLAGFAGLPMISLVTPLLVLPVLGRVAGVEGWASLAAGESIGTLAAIVVAYGWNTGGPARVAMSRDATTRARDYRDSLLVRGALAAVAVPVVVLLCVAVSAHGYTGATVLMGLNATVTGLSFAWFAVGAGDPRSIALLEAVPRVLAAVASAALVLVTRDVAVYPLLAVAVSLGGIVVFTRRTLRGHRFPRPTAAELRRLVVRDRAVAFNDIAGGAYQAVPVPVVTTVATAAAAASYASGDKLWRFGQYVPITLAHAFQSWTAEGGPADRGRRLRVALAAHVGVGVVGAVVLTLLGPRASALLFGPDVATTTAVCAWLAAAFLLMSVRTSLTRHVLVPAARLRPVVASTVAGACVGVPAVLALVHAYGAVGAAAGLALGELVATTVLVPPGRAVLRAAGHPAAAAPGPDLA